MSEHPRRLPGRCSCTWGNKPDCYGITRVHEFCPHHGAEAVRLEEKRRYELVHHVGRTEIVEGSDPLGDELAYQAACSCGWRGATHKTDRPAMNEAYRHEDEMERA